VTEISDRLSKQFSADRIVFSVDSEGGKTAASLPADTFQFETLEQALNTLTRINTEAVLVDLEHGPIHNLVDLARLLEVARCPLVVFGTSVMVLPD
jgi:hypothetical protein